jgi:hypothetical protein
MGLSENNIYKEKVPAENGGWGKDARERLFPLPRKESLWARAAKLSFLFAF